MNTSSGTSKHDLDEVLFAFAKACPAPTSEDVAEWGRRYPQLASEINDHAAAMIFMDLTAALDEPETGHGEDDPLEGLDEFTALLAAADAPAVRTISDLAAEVGTDINGLAQVTRLHNVILAKLDAGLIALPVGGKLPGILAGALSVTREAVQEAIRHAAAIQLTAEASTASSPNVTRQTYAEALKAAGLSEDQIRDLLED